MKLKLGISKFFSYNLCMRKHETCEKDVERFNPVLNIGLTEDEVNIRREQGLTNFTPLVVGKSNWEIIRTDVLSFFNILLFSLCALIIYGNVNDTSGYVKWYSGLFTLVITLCNVGVTLFQDFKAKHLMKKTKLLTTQKACVIRDGKEMMIDPTEIVLDDILLLRSGEQIPSDSYILSGEVSVNESLITGESVDVNKKKGDMVLSGTYVTNGFCYTRVERVGKENYIETLSAKAKTFKRNPSHLLKSLKYLFRFLGILIIIMFSVVIITYGTQGAFASKNDFVNIISPITGQFIAMVPAGLYLLTTVTLVTGVISLHKRKAHVQDLYSIEMLARTEVICVDKTGTITDGTMVLKEVKSLNKLSNDEIGNIVTNIIEATKDNNSTAKALKESFNSSSLLEVSACLPFNSANKYSGATFVSGVTYLFGAAEYLNLANKDKILKDIKEYTSRGLRVLVLAKGKEAISGKKYTNEVTAIAYLVLQDHIKDSAKETFAWFENNGVQIKVISGDNALTVSEIAQEAGIKDAHKFISLEGMSIEEVKKIALDYVVFGRVTPEQKEALVIALKEQKLTVAMTGDGINDMLALKRADCSIAMNSGSQAAKNVSHIVLLNNDFSTMPDIVAEGRRSINNIERTGSLFLTKTFFAIMVSIIFWITAIVTSNEVSYPFSPSNLMIWEIFGIGLSAFFIALERNPKPITKGFLRNILTKAIPSSIIILIGVMSCYVAYLLQKNGVCYTGVSELGFVANQTRLPRSGATAIAILVFTSLSLMVLFNTCRPMNKYRGIVVGSAVLISAGLFAAAPFIPYNLFNINFTSISDANLVLWASITVILSAVIFFSDPISQAIGKQLTRFGHFVSKKFKQLFSKEKHNEN